MRLLFGLLIVFMLQSSAFAGNIYTPKAGTTERKSIMNASRVPIMKELAGQKIVFVVRKLKVSDRWAYLEAVPRLKSGGKVNYMITQYKDDVKQGFFDDWVGVLLFKAGGQWKVKTYTIGATDYPVVGWPEAFGAPKGLFQ